jgi:hypothetical protein
MEGLHGEQQTLAYVENDHAARRPGVTHSRDELSVAPNQDHRGMNRVDDNVEALSFL